MNELTIIAFYPGAGGHRLKNKLLGFEYETAGKIYHYNGSGPMHPHYLTTDSETNYLTTESEIILDNKIILTHCMNIDVIKKIIPNKKIIQIVADYKASLRRHWVLVGKQLKQHQFENILDNAYTCIKWHDQYYKEYPVTGLADTVINISTSDDDFSTIMKKELNINDQIFDTAWTIFEQYGADAPIIDLYNQHISQRKA